MSDNDQRSLERLKLYLPLHLSKGLSLDTFPDEAGRISQYLSSVRTVLSTYLPRYLVESIGFDSKPGRVSGEFRYGTVLFADVSGFTAMSEKLSSLGKEGAEELTRIVNDYFISMLDVSAGYGGDLLKFGGDALLIFFEGDSGPWRALSAAIVMEAAMKSFTDVQTSKGSFPLRMKIGMSSGPIFLTSLGTSEKMDYAVMGPTLTTLFEAENRASAGQIVMDSATQKAVEEGAKATAIGEGYFRIVEAKVTEQPSFVSWTPSSIVGPEDVSGPDSLLQACLNDERAIAGLSPFVPVELLARIVADPYRPTLYSSHRPVTVMFANFLGADEIIKRLGPGREEIITAILNTHFVTMAEVVSRFGGTVNRLDTYSRGHRILALFGALKAHEDDPQRAVRTAMEMNRSLKRVNEETRELLRTVDGERLNFDKTHFSQRIGINSGFVFAGNTGSELRREYTVMGDQVNLTARLMGVSREGEVLLGQRTARMADSEFTLVEEVPVTVKGIRDPVRSYRVTGAKERTRQKFVYSSSPIVGRDAELRLGQQAITQVHQSHGRVLSIHGVSGIGKSRLTEEIIFHGDQIGMHMLVGNCVSYGRTMTYLPWTEILRTLFGIRAGDPQDRRKRLDAVHRGMVAIDEASWTPLIGTVLGLDIPHNELTRELDPKLRRQRVLDLILKLLIAQAHEQPLMIVIEDAQWADPASVDVIDYVTRNIADQPILFILPHRSDAGLPDRRHMNHVVDIPLKDLSSDACKKIVQNMLDETNLPDSLYEVIQNRGCGNPFFVGEVVRALIDTGALTQNNAGDWKVIPDIAGVELPDTIHGVIHSRIDRLKATNRHVLQVSSVVGQIFDHQTVNEVYPFDDLEDSLRWRLGTLNEHGLTEIHDIEAEIYRFIHLTTREVVYESLPFAHRRSLHRNIGGYLERISADSLGEQIDLLAYHFYEGHAWEKAMEYNLMAAHHAQSEYANETAISSCYRSLKASTNLGPDIDSSQTRIEAHETLGEVLTLVGQYDKALRHCQLAQAIVSNAPKSPEKLRHMAELSRKNADINERISEYDLAFDWIAKGLNYVEVDKATIEAARLNLLGAGIYRRLGKNDEAANWCQRSLEIASQVKTREGYQAVGQAYYNLGGIHYRRGDFHSALSFCRQSLDVYEQIVDIAGQARAFTNLGATYSDLGDWNQAMDAYNSSLTINQRIGDVQRQGFLANNLANLHLYRGEWEHAASLF